MATDAERWTAIPLDELEAALHAAAVADVRQQLVELNPTCDHRELLATPTWDLQSYTRAHRPAIVGWIPQDARAALSTGRGDRVQDLPFRMPGQGWCVPRLLAPYLPAIRIALDAERAINADFAASEDDYHAYITIDQKLVEPHRTQRRQGFHGDAFMTPENADLGRVALTENTYLVCDALPTEFKPGPFDIADVYPDIAACLARFDEVAALQPTITMPPYAVIRITPYHVHSPAVNHSDETVQRTFVKITFSRERFNRDGNAKNPLCRYDNWFWVPRTAELRNLRNVIVDWDRPDRDRFLAVSDPTQLSAEWCDLHIFWAFKTLGVRAERAKPGASLQTTVGGFAISVNVAEEGDWLIATAAGGQYFLSDATFRDRYHAEPDGDGFHAPSPQPLPMVRITAPIRFRAPWGAMQYVPPGSVLVLKHHDVYAIHGDSFAMSYQTLDDRADAEALVEAAIAVVRAAAERSAELIRTRRASAAASVAHKADDSVVTALDYEVQRLYIEALFARPELAGRIYVVGEESLPAAGVSRTILEQNKLAFGHAELVIVIDPIDNTRGYVGSDTTNYATVAAVLHRGRPIYYIAIAPEALERYEARSGDGVRHNGTRVPRYEGTLGAPAALLAAGLHWVDPVDPLAEILPAQFAITDRFGSYQLAAARMVRREPGASCDGTITAGFPYHETIPAAAILHLAGAATVRSNGLAFFPIQWSDLAARRPHQLIAGCTSVVNLVRQLRIVHPQTPTRDHVERR
jgi:fructose-1,6-bisphosphatase/inositol monophosphatase family enzyme